MEVNTSEPPSERSRIARAAGLISALTLVSRVLGLVREQVFAALVGAGYHSDAFRIGFRIPNLLRDLFAEGALSAAFVPIYVRAMKERGREGAFVLANRVLTFLAVVLAALVVVGIVFAPWIVSALASGFEGSAGKTELTVRLTRIMMPFLPVVSFAAVAMGMLNARGALRLARPLAGALQPRDGRVRRGAVGDGPPAGRRSSSAGPWRPLSAASRSSRSRCRRCGGPAGASIRSGRSTTRRCARWAA